jgi:hypothetical protein
MHRASVDNPLVNDFYTHVHHRPVDRYCGMHTWPGLSTATITPPFPYLNNSLTLHQCSPTHTTTLVMCEIIETQYVFQCACGRMAGPVNTQVNKCSTRDQAEIDWWRWHSTGRHGNEPSMACTSMTVEQKLPYDRPCQECWDSFQECYDYAMRKVAMRKVDAVEFVKSYHRC